MDVDKKRYLRDQLLNWYESEKRDLPWREEDPDPYKVWVSEVMLQQTQVDTVIPYYERFIRQFPTLEDLAAAEEPAVLKSWEGLGYYSRARHLHQGVREVCEQYGGRIPDTLEEIRRIKGVGPYTAGAILSIAYGKVVPAVDGNVMRVISRLFCIDEDVTSSSTRKKIENLVQHLIPEGSSSAFNQALMELGAVICTSRNVGCLICPLREVCKAYITGRQKELPVKRKKKQPRVVSLVAGVLWQKGKVFIHKRSQEGLLANLWEFPHFEWDDAVKRWEDLEEEHKVSFFVDRFVHEYGFKVRFIRYLMPIHHTFTHLRWEGDAFVFAVEPEENAFSQDDITWVEPWELSHFTFPVAFKKMAQAMIAEPF